MTETPQFYTPYEVGRLTGFSANFILKEIKAGELEAVYVKSARSKVGRWRISVAAACAYARKIGTEQPHG